MFIIEDKKIFKKNHIIYKKNMLNIINIKQKWLVSKIGCHSFHYISLSLYLFLHMVLQFNIDILLNVQSMVWVIRLIIKLKNTRC